MTDIFYDTEFLERGPGHPVDLISIGMSGPAGEELYLVSLDFDRRAVAGHPWLMANVVPSLPYSPAGDTIVPDPDHADYDALAGRETIAATVRDFVLSWRKPRLWADYGAYDHVAVCQLFGTMTELPAGFPMFTCDLQQEAARLGEPEIPALPGATRHRAIDDAREVRFRAEWLQRREISARGPW